MWAWGEGKVEVVEGKCSSCFLARKGPGGHTQPAVQHSTWVEGRVAVREEDGPLDRYTTLVQRRLHGPGFIPFLS